MLRGKRTRIAVLFACTFVMAVLQASLVARAQDSRAQRDGRAALPSEAELTGCRELRYETRKVGASVEATRTSDELRVRVAAHVLADVKGARRVANRWVSPLPMSPLSWSGRQIGDAVFTSNYQGGGPPRGAFTVFTRSGRAAVRVDLIHRITRGNGKPVQPVFSEADLRWAEDVAIGCVERLKKMGYGDEQERKAQSRTRGGKKPKDK